MARRPRRAARAVRRDAARAGAGAARAGRVAGAAALARRARGRPAWRCSCWAAPPGPGCWPAWSAPQPALQAGSGEWLQRAAVAHAVYVPEKRHPVEVSVAQNQDGHLARWLTKRLDVPVKLFDLNPQGFDLVGGRLLPDERGPSAQLMYENAAGPARHRLPAQARHRPRRPGRRRVPLRTPGRTRPVLLGRRPGRRGHRLRAGRQPAARAVAGAGGGDLSAGWGGASGEQPVKPGDPVHAACRVRRASAWKGLMSDNTSVSASRAMAMS